MSLLEKIIGIAVILIVCFVFMILIIMVSMYMMKWMQKGVNPNQTFPHNPKGGGLTMEQQRALNAGAILSGTNSDFCDSLHTSRTFAKKVIGEFMERDWGIKSAQGALERLEDLKYSGHREMCSFILKNASQLLTTGEHSSVNPRDIFRITGFSLLDKRILTEYADEIGLAQQHIDLIDEVLKASSLEDIKKYEDLFGSEETFSICIQIYHRFYDQCVVYASRIANLKQTLPYLQETGYLGTDLSQFGSEDVSAWDLGRMVNVARYSYDLGYISEAQAWDYIFYAQKESAAHYADWAAFGRGYIIGRAMWGGENMNLYVAVGVVKKLKTSKKSPWILAPLH